MVTLPGFTPVTLPVELTRAMEVLLEEAVIISSPGTESYMESFTPSVVEGAVTTVLAAPTDTVKVPWPPFSV